MEIWSLIFYITAFASFIIPTIFCYIKFSKGGKGSCIGGTSAFITINFAPSFGSSGGAVIDSFLTLMIVIWIIGIAIGIAIPIMNWKIIERQEPKTKHDDFAFNHSTGVSGSYAFLYFVLYGTLILFIEDDENFSFFELAYRKHAWIYYIIELIYFTGFFFSSSSVFFILKYDLNKFILIIIMIVQGFLYTINIVIIIDFRDLYIIILVTASLIEIGFGLYIWKKYYSNVDDPLISENENKKTELMSNSDNSEINQQV